MKLKIFFCQFPNPWALRVSGMGGYTSKCEKSKNHCTLLYSILIHRELGEGERFTRAKGRGATGHKGWSKIPTELTLSPIYKL